jgi:2-methylcitrate dehydratase PrpD
MSERNSGAAIEQTIAHHIATVRFEDLPAKALQATKEHILHTTATVLAGSAAPGCAAFMDLLLEWGGVSESSVLAWGLRVPAHHAAMANSLMGHAQDFDNNDDRIAYKTSVCAIPSALAVAERLGAMHGRDVIAAVCTGIDLGIRMGLAILPQPAHPTAHMLGPFAAATAAAKLLRLDDGAIWDALGLAMCGVSPAGSSTSGLSYSKRYLAGAASRNGVMAAMLAGRGFRARRAIFSGVGNYYRIIHGLDGALDIILDGLGEQFEVVNVGPKAFPCCRYTHGPVEAALAMTLEGDLRPQDVKEIRVTVGPRDYQIVFGGDGGLTSKQEPRSVVDAQFSIPYTVAAAIAQRRLFLDDMTEQAIARPEIIALAKRVVPVVEQSFDNWPADVKPSSVEIATVSGATCSRRIDYPKGNPRNPVPLDEMRRNFIECAARAVRPVPRERAERARDLIENLETCTDVRAITTLLSPPPHDAAPH